MANYDINYNDERFTQVETDKTTALNEMEKTYSGMITDSDKFYQQQIDASKAWADKQSQIQQEQTDFAIEKIEQEKEQTRKDYLKEQSGAYVDWRKQSNEYGVKAEEMASAGLANTGYSESSQVSMYNTYQNRVATARETYNRALMNFTNAMKDARLQNNAALAEIAFNAFKEQAQFALEGFQYKNNLILQQANQKLEIENNYYNRYQDVLAQINHENALAEQIRQYNEQMAEDKRQFDAQMAMEREQFEWQKAQAAARGGGGGSTGNAKVSSGSTPKIKKGGSGVPKDTSEVVSKHNVVSGRVAEALAMYEVNKAKKVFLDAITGR